MRLRVTIIFAALCAATVTGCGQSTSPYAAAPAVIDYVPPTVTEYRLGPGESINVFVWEHPDLTTTVPIRPDGRFSMPLVEDMPAAGKTPTRLARDIEERLKQYVRDPLVTVIAQGGAGDPSQQIRVLGAAVNPTTLPYREGMTVLDVVIAVGGLNEFAAGNRAVLARAQDGRVLRYRLRLGDLLEGDIAANRPMIPGDTLIIPQSFL